MSNTSELFAIAAHLHVLLRRKTGRVTDTEWMVANADYAREVVRYTREKAVSEQHPDLLPWAAKLEAAIVSMSATPRRTLLEVAADSLRPSPRPGAATAPGAPNAPADDHYVGGLR
ncbi:MAG: hypothetical protein KF871_03995 [Hydrogenophaga sp.]|uniref:hypothetical protein n=1 Tax=Hydrogenophaga sp. TaxID=1904254 RepID=UPI001D216768|nr:hypothetical protein [Hydrogenophaga sp.]MBX3609035.1 hypothetical protein [Hydrogenophaga sp.]